MRKILVFNSITADGYFTDKKGDMSWAHKQDPEWTEFVADNSTHGGELLFGRITYEMMASFWPTPAAAKQFPEVAEQMNIKRPIVIIQEIAEIIGNWKKYATEVDVDQKLKAAINKTLLIIQ